MKSCKKKVERKKERKIEKFGLLFISGKKSKKKNFRIFCLIKAYQTIKNLLSLFAF